ncbi:MAG: DNA repair protein RecN [Chitinophagaceae bacterium]|nr:MAG: DNA repair protein RecN [Chitinophagaceae bacterium]
MLLRLYIKNYAIIEELEIGFSGNLNVITGETGAGKSILLGALSLILGERADLNVLKDTRDKAIIEGVFNSTGKEDIQHFFRENELDTGREIIIRREINPSGKSRAFINDTPVNLQQLNQLGTLLVDLHQQFDTLQLHRADFQLEVLDALAGNQASLKQYGEIFSKYVRKQKELDLLREQYEKNARELDYDQFLFDELETAGFKENELEDLEQEQQMLTHAEDLKNALSAANAVLQDDESSAVSLLRQAQSKLENISRYQADIPGLLDRLHSSAIELSDIASELERINDHASIDNERTDYIQERLDTGYKLLKKHGVHTTADLLNIKKELQKKLDNVQHAEEDLSILEKERDRLLKQSGETAGKLSAARKSILNDFIKKTNSLMATVGMPNAQIKVEIHQVDLNETGQDAATFLFDANKSGNFQPVRKVASGGELSRLMLCIKSFIARSVSLPTLIFDEIDSGISGEAARQVGNIMKDLANTHQVICITHQPQIAGKAHTHFEVFKEDKNGKVQTGIRALSREERVQTIAQMLSGDKPGKAALENARELMEGV